MANGHISWLVVTCKRAEANHGTYEWLEFVFRAINVNPVSRTLPVLAITCTPVTRYGLAKGHLGPVASLLPVSTARAFRERDAQDA